MNVWAFIDYTSMFFLGAMVCHVVWMYVWLRRWDKLHGQLVQCSCVCKYVNEVKRIIGGTA